jgi:tungstate transport system ATP-binding protein
VTNGHSNAPGIALEAAGLAVELGGVKVLDIPALQVRQSEVLMIIGPNGSGKSTLLLTLASLLKPKAGTISYDGVTAGDHRAIVETRRKLAVVFQEPLLLNRNVMENVTLGLRLRGVRGTETKARAEKWLDRFGVAHLAKRQGRMLSGGEAKRVSLARALALEPQILFLDEPFVALDTPTRQALLEDFESVLRETRVTTVMVTHDHNEALALGDRIAVLMNGSIRQLGTPEEVFLSPADEDVARFLETGNIWFGVISTQKGGLAAVSIDGGVIQAVSDLAPYARVTAYLHQEDVTLSLPVPMAAPSSARNQMKGTIVRSFPHGAQLKVTVDCGFAISSLITRHSWEELGLGIGKSVIASFKASSVHLIPKL